MEEKEGVGVEKVIKRLPRPRAISNPFNLLLNETDGTVLLLKGREG